MNRLANPVLMLVPHDALGGVLLLFIVLGGICRILGATKASTALIATAIAVPFVTVLVEVLFNQLFVVLPPSLVQIVAWLVLALVYLAICGALMSLVFGESVWTEAKGHILATVLMSIFRLAFSWPMLLVWAAGGVYVWWKSA